MPIDQTKAAGSENQKDTAKTSQNQPTETTTDKSQTPNEGGLTISGQTNETALSIAAEGVADGSVLGDVYNQQVAVAYLKKRQNGIKELAEQTVNFGDTTRASMTSIDADDLEEKAQQRLAEIQAAQAQLEAEGGGDDTAVKKPTGTAALFAAQFA